MPQTSASRIRTFNPPVNSRPVDGCNPFRASTSGDTPRDMYHGMYQRSRF
ncbi:MAG: hypothetical protein JWO38_4796 [Gemmataceae bacterium]|nr:hypothetical protein [Gemmataceae bacterium]